MDLQKLKEERKKLDALIAEEEEKQLNIKRTTVKNKILSYSEEEKKFMLSLVRHSCSSCSDESPYNGYCNGKYRCSKCMLMEILNGEHDGDFDFHFDVFIEKVTV